MTSNIRKIGRVGKYTKVLTLPTFWLSTVGLDAGDNVILSVGRNKELVVKPYKEKKHEIVGKRS